MKETKEKIIFVPHTFKKLLKYYIHLNNENPWKKKFVFK